MFLQHKGSHTDREEKKKYTTTTERKSFGELFWPKEKLSRLVVDTRCPIKKTRKTISTTEIFPLWTPSFFSAKTAGRCMLSFSHRNAPSRAAAFRNTSRGMVQKYQKDMPHRVQHEWASWDQNGQNKVINFRRVCARNDCAFPATHNQCF